jgi:hypothetical protein
MPVRCTDGHLWVTLSDRASAGDSDILKRGNWAELSVGGGRICRMTDTGGSESNAGPNRPGPVHDRSLRGLVGQALPTFAKWLGVPVDDDYELLSESFTAETRQTDLLARVGLDQLLHVEYISEPKKDTTARITQYRGHIMERHPGKSIAQYGLVLGKGRLRSGDDEANGFRLGLKTIYLRECDGEPLLTDAHLAPLAVLARGDKTDRAEYLGRALKIVDGDQDKAFLREAPLDLAVMTLDRSTIDKVMEETGMSTESVADFYSGTRFGQEIKNRGRTEGLTEGLVRGRADLLRVVLRDRFGEDPRIEAIASRLAEIDDATAAVHAINHAATLDEL